MLTITKIYHEVTDMLSLPEALKLKQGERKLRDVPIGVVRYTVLGRLSTSNLFNEVDVGHIALREHALAHATGPCGPATPTTVPAWIDEVCSQPNTAMYATVDDPLLECVVSRFHAVVRVDQATLVAHIQGLGCTNGVFVDGVKIPAFRWVPLPVGAVVRFSMRKANAGVAFRDQRLALNGWIRAPNTAIVLGPMELGVEYVYSRMLSADVVERVHEMRRLAMPDLVAVEKIALAYQAARKAARVAAAAAAAAAADPVEVYEHLSPTYVPDDTAGMDDACP